MLNSSLNPVMFRIARLHMDEMEAVAHRRALAGECIGSAHNGRRLLSLSRCAAVRLLTLTRVSRRLSHQSATTSA
jgi:hypothetical protein